MPKNPHETVSSKPLQALVAEKGWSFAKAGLMLGVSASSIRKWCNEGQMPPVAELAVRQVAGAAKVEAILIVRGPADQIAALEIAAAAMGLSCAPLQP